MSFFKQAEEPGIGATRLMMYLLNRHGTALTSLLTLTINRRNLMYTPG